MASTPDQASVISRDGHTLVCALPGSGKTYTLVELAVTLIRKNPEYTVLLITFTDAAKIELEERLRAKTEPYEMKRIEVSTFHSTALRMVKSKLGKRLIMGPQHSILVRRVLEHAEQSGINTFGLTEYDALSLFEKMGRTIGAESGYGIEEQTLYSFYKDTLNREGVVDFSIVCSTAVSWLSQEEIAPLPFTHILADEYQDTDEIQYLWLYEHGIRGTKLYVVGDDDQSIYSFRGGQGYENMVRFQNDFDAEAYILRDCFRCGKEILARAAELISYNTDRIEKPMNAARDEAGKVEFVWAGDKDNEINKLVDRVSEAPESWAVIARTNLSLDDVEAALKIYGIEYTRLGGRSIFDTTAAYGIVKILQLISGCSDDSSARQALGLLKIDQKALNNVTHAMVKKNIPFSHLPVAIVKNQGLLTSAHHVAEQWVDTTNKQKKITLLNNALELLGRCYSKGELGIAKVVCNMLLNRENQSINESIKALAIRVDEPRRKKPNAGEPKLTLTTMHSAKGLQFDNVWIFRAEADCIPSPDSVAEGLVQEERRLMYVAMTRAIRQLCISFRSNPSEFIAEASPSYYESWLEAKANAKAKASNKSEDAA